MRRRVVWEEYAYDENASDRGSALQSFSGWLFFIAGNVADAPTHGYVEMDDGSIKEVVLVDLQFVFPGSDK